MLFNSYVFIFVFLPAAVLMFHGLRRCGFERSAIGGLILMSFVFYGWWDPKYLLLLIPLMLTDFVLAKWMVKRGQGRGAVTRGLLAAGVAINLGALCYFKYANFFVDNVNELFGLNLFLATIVLPIGISFYTFQKVAFLVDVYQGKVGEFRLLDYALFVCFFPQLIAGPIVHHSEMMPQFRKLVRVPPAFFALGLTCLSIGLAKKVLLADTAALFATPQFDAAAAGASLDMVAAWGASLAYTAQLYFDFSAYSDMAIGIGLLFGIRLPVNFDSPYKAASIVEFWRRWHITLSRFLRDYLYISLGGNRKGQLRRYANLMITMVLGGLWHGAGWTFVVWGSLHGLYLMVNHAWHACKRRLGLRLSNPWTRKLAQLITFLAVVVAWVFFRADSLPTATSILKGMFGFHGVVMPSSTHRLLEIGSLASLPNDGGTALMVALAILLIAWLAP
ncbi:MAG: MBOAT family protein, partial [Gammaproteobacteria bacterium]|nr:MBOAT family protein [Gammaproteobacteria bacterium]